MQYFEKLFFMTKLGALYIIVSDKISTRERERSVVLFYQMEYEIRHMMKFGRVCVTEKPFAKGTGTPGELLHPLSGACAIQSFISPSIA